MVISSQGLTGAGAERFTVTSSEEPSFTLPAADSETYTEPVSSASSSIVISAEDGLPIVSQVSQPY